MKILVSDLHSASNRGDGAILDGMLTLLREEFPRAGITVLTDYPEAARQLHRVSVGRQPFSSFAWRWVGRGMIMSYLLFSALIARRLGLRLPFLSHPVLAPYLEADLVLSKGGGFFSDHYWPGFLGRAWALGFAKALGKPVVLFGQSIGPLNLTLSRLLSGALFRSLNLSIVRDARSRGWLEGLGVPSDRIVDGVDPAFALPPPASADPRLFEAEGVAFGEGREWVSVSVRQWPYMSRPDGHQRYLKAVAGMVDWLVTEEEMDVLFASTCTDLDGYHTDDRVCAAEVVTLLSPPVREKVVILQGDYSAAELAAVYGEMRLHVGTRLHSNILAVLAGTPVVGVAYEFKTTEIFDTLGLGDFVVPIEGLDKETLVGIVKDALSEEGDTRARLPRAIGRMRVLAREMAREVNRVWETHVGARGGEP